MENTIINQALLCGEMLCLPKFSHENHGKSYYVFPLSVKRLSDAYDTINILASSEIINRMAVSEGSFLAVSGEIRSYNNRQGSGNKLIISVLAFDIKIVNDEPKNEVTLVGTICKAPVFRQTPLGREICDIMLAVNRKYQRTDYLPCIVWGHTAYNVSQLAVGSRVKIDGRLQSRDYVKQTEDMSEKRTAFEISAINVEILDS